MFEIHTYFKALEFPGRSLSNRESNAQSLSRKFDREFPFLERIPQHSSDLFCDLSIMAEDGAIIGRIMVGVFEGVHVMNNFYLYPEFRNHGYFTTYMPQLCGGDIPFVLRPIPGLVFTENGIEPQNQWDFYFHKLTEETTTDKQSIERITTKYRSFGLLPARVQSSDKDFLTSYLPDENKNVTVISE